MRQIDFYIRILLYFYKSIKQIGDKNECCSSRIKKREFLKCIP